MNEEISIQEEKREFSKMKREQEMHSHSRQRQIQVRKTGMEKKSARDNKATKKERR
jgi:hypothetical protein